MFQFRVVQKRELFYIKSKPKVGETMLTEKQRNFCKEYIQNGGNGRQAYLAAYDSNSPSSAGIEATRLLGRDDIQAYLTKLRKPIEKAVVRKMVNERETKKNLIQERIAVCIERDDDAAIARYLDIWNKLDGDYININKDITDHNAEIINLDTETLKTLAAGG